MGFSDDIMAANALSGGVQGFIQGMRDSEDRKFKQLELDSKHRADTLAKERQAKLDEVAAKDKEFDDRAKLKTAGFKLPELREGQSIRDVDLNSLPVDKEYLNAKGAVDPFGAKARPTEGEFTASNFSTRMSQANNELENLLQTGFNPTTTEVAIQEALPNSGLIGKVAQSAKNPQVKAYEQAKRNFITAVLRKESGAAIGKEEYATEDMKYFPQAGDTPEVLAQKERTRKLAIQNMSAQGGRAMGLMAPGRMKSGGLMKESAPPPPANDLAKKKARLEELQRKAEGG